MRLMVKLLVATALAVVLTAGVALAANIRCDGGPCNGTNRGDTLTGSAKPDRMNGLGGQDSMDGNRRGDVMFGGTGSDNMSGGFGADRMQGGSLNDILSGGIARDRLVGGAGSDTMRGETGNDRIFAADGRSDSIDCGTGRDTAVVDLVQDLQGAPLQQFISASSCETVNARP